MKAKKDNTKKYVVGGYIQAGLGAAQAVYGLSQIPRARAEFAAAQASAPSLETPAQFYENYRNAYDAEIARMESESIDRNIGTSVQALQGAGGRALVGGLSAVTGQAQNERNRMLSQERAMRLQAGQQLAAAEERSVQMREARSQAQMDRAAQQYNAALANVGAGISSMASGLAEGIAASKAKQDEKPGGIIERLRARYGDMYISQRQRTDKEIADISQKNNDMIRGSFSPEVDFAKNYLGRFEKPATSVTRELTTAERAARAAGQGFGEYDFTTEKIKALGLPQPGAYDMLLGRSTNPDAIKSTPVPTITAPTTGGVTEFNKKQENLMDFGRTVKNAFSRENLINAALSTNPSLQNAMKGYGTLMSMGVMGYEQGGMMTNGAFNHNTNPIHLVQNGEKVGEATGGEYILNPEQAKAVAKESSYARKLFKRFEKNAKKNK